MKSPLRVFDSANGLRYRYFTTVTDTKGKELSRIEHPDPRKAKTYVERWRLNMQRIGNPRKLSIGYLKERI